MMVLMILGTSCNLFLGSQTSPSEGGVSSQGAASTESGAPLESTAPSPRSGSPQGGAPSVGPCQAAPGWLVTLLQGGLAVRGATLTEMYIGEAWGFSSGPPAVMSAEFASAWWIVAKINGAGVRPEAAVWVTNRTGPVKTGTIFGANPAAVRYSKFGDGGSSPIRGQGQEDALACLTPIPQS